MEYETVPHGFFVLRDVSLNHRLHRIALQLALNLELKKVTTKIELTLTELYRAIKCHEDYMQNAPAVI